MTDGLEPAGQAVAVKPVTSDDEKPDVLEIAGTVLLGAAAVLIAWTTFQAGLWGGVQDTRNTRSALVMVNATDDLGRADTISAVDQLLFADWLKTEAGSVEEANIVSQMSDPGKEAVERWRSNELVRPGDDPQYILEIYGEGAAKFEASGELFNKASEANKTSDDYTEAATIVALVLFLSGVSLVLSGNTTRVILMGLSAAVLVVVAFNVLRLPESSDEPEIEELEETLIAKARAAIEAEFALIEQSSLEDAPLENVSGDTETPPVELPPNDFVPAEGETAFAVYIAVIEGSPDSPGVNDGLVEAVIASESFGYQVYSGDLACDDGAAAAFGIDDAATYSSASVYFATPDDVEAFAAVFDEAYPGGVVGIAEVQTLCLE